MLESFLDRGSGDGFAGLAPRHALSDLARRDVRGLGRLPEGFGQPAFSLYSHPQKTAYPLNYRLSAIGFRLSANIGRWLLEPIADSRKPRKE
jgi:hypothetical protein